MSVLFRSVVLINRMISSYMRNCCSNSESSINDLQSGERENGEEKDNDVKLSDERKDNDVKLSDETNVTIGTNDILDIVNSLIDDVFSIIDNMNNRNDRKIIKSVVNSLIEKVELRQLKINLSYSALELKKTNSINSLASDFYNVSPFTSITSITATSTNVDSTPFKISNKVTQSFDSTESVLGDMDDYIMDGFDDFVDCNEFDENNEEKDMEDETNNKISQQSFPMYFDDFVLTESIDFSKVFFSITTHEYISAEKSHEHIRKNISVIITFIIDSNTHPNVATIFIQLVIRFLVNNPMSQEEFLYFVTLAFRFACILEYDRTGFEDIKFLGKKFRLNCKTLLIYEEKLFKFLDYRLYLDNIFNHFTEKEMFFLCHDKKCQNEYYKFICDIDIYLRSSKYNTELFRNLHLKNINDISD